MARLARQEDAILRRQGRLWAIVLFAMLLAPRAAAHAGDVTVETYFDDDAPYQPLRLIDERSDKDFGLLPIEPEPLLTDENPPFDDEALESSLAETYEFQILPRGLMYRSYIAGEKEPRFQSVWLNETGRGRVWETQLGGRVGLLRYGTTNAVNPQGWQLDMEGGAQARVDPQQHSDLEAVDFRFGLLSTWRFGRNAIKAGYYHLSTHAGDEFLIRIPTFHRINYVRDSAIIGWTHDITENMSVYAEAAYAAGAEGGAKPLEFQYGYQYTPLRAYGLKGAPYFGVNGHTRQDRNWITSVNTVAGWQWRGEQTNHLFRLGMQYYTGPALQWEFVGRNETLCGAGLWFDY